MTRAAFENKKPAMCGDMAGETFRRVMSVAVCDIVKISRCFRRNYTYNRCHTLFCQAKKMPCYRYVPAAIINHGKDKSHA